MDCTKIELKQGSQGTDVKELQTILQGKGFYGGVIDGDFGPMTVDAVKKYQRSANLLTDAIVGPITCKALHSTAQTSSAEITSFEKLKGKKFLKDEITSAAKIYRQHIKNNKNYPNYITMKDTNGTVFNVPRSVYMGIFEGVSQFFVKNGRVPNYVVVSGTANNPHAIDYQNNAVNCGPASTSMCMQMLGLWVTEATLASKMGTNKYGTGPAQMIKTVKDYGVEFVEISRDLSSVKKAINEGSPVLMHINTAYSGGKSCLGYINEYGHYIMCYGISGEYYLLADPTKGYKKCYYSTIDKAKSSSNMKYYRMNVL